MDTQAGTAEDVKALLSEILGIGDRVQAMDAMTPLIGSLPELDSMAVAELFAAMEDRFGVDLDEAEVGAEALETLGSLTEFVDANRH
jgi:acyl carrier protein